MKRTIKYILAACLAVSSLNVFAQGLRSAYFLDGFVYRHEMNPAFMGERNYVAIPIFGQINIGAQSNVGLLILFLNIIILRIVQQHLCIQVLILSSF